MICTMDGNMGCTQSVYTGRHWMCHVQHNIRAFKVERNIRLTLKCVNALSRCQSVKFRIFDNVQTKQVNTES